MKRTNYDDRAYNSKRPRRDSGGYYGGDSRPMAMGSINDMTGLPNMNPMQTMSMAMPLMSVSTPQGIMGMQGGMAQQASYSQGYSHRETMGGYNGRASSQQSAHKPYGDQMSRGSRDDRYSDPAYSQREIQQAAATIEPQKTENAINLLLGLSKMLKGQNSEPSRDAGRGEPSHSHSHAQDYDAYQPYPGPY